MAAKDTKNPTVFVFTHPHRLWILMSEEGEERSEAAETSGEENEEWQLFLGVDWHLVKHWQQLPVRTLWNIKCYYLPRWHIPNL